MEELRLRPVTLADEVEARAAHRELEPFPFLLDADRAGSWAELVELYARLRAGTDLPPDRVRAALLLADVRGAVVGRVSVRFELNDWLAEHGGHIGYAVRPAFRGRGVAKAMLGRSLELLRAEGCERALLTCDETNAASAAVIEACGGVFERHADGEGEPRRRYWVSL